MNNKRIIIDIDEKGNISIDGQGFIGTECKSFLKEIADNIGNTINSTKKKEYNMKTNTKQKEKN